ncbi:MAG TPA: hypothetical protein VKP52_11710, partial [Pseudolabrys sp.]|nr:hypothetical protein [Pseudolabrys sp.]
LSTSTFAAVCRLNSSANGKFSLFHAPAATIKVAAAAAAPKVNNAGLAAKIGVSEPAQRLLTNVAPSLATA